MTNKVTNLNEQRRKKKPRSLEEVAKDAARRYLDPERLETIKEPEGLASGKTTESGSFVHDNEKADDEESDNEEQ